MPNPSSGKEVPPGAWSQTALRIFARYKRVLLIAGVVFLALFAMELLYLHGHAASRDGRMRTLALTLPPLGALLCLLPVCYLAWFRQPEPRRLRQIKLALFWLLAIFAILILGNVVWLSLGLRA